MAAEDSNRSPLDLTDHAIIGGFGVPGRAFAEWVARHGIAYVVIEQNESIVGRCGNGGVPIIAGDVRDELTLRHAGIEKAAIVALTVPVESVVLQAIAVVRRLNPNARVLARVQYISTGLDAIKRGADEAVVAEELAAKEFVRLLEGGRSTIRSA